MKKITFYGMTQTISDETFNRKVFNVDFHGRMMVQFIRHEDDSLTPVNAMNGWGDNCYEEIELELPEIEEAFE